MIEKVPELGTTPRSRRFVDLAVPVPGLRGTLPPKARFRRDPVSDWAMRVANFEPAQRPVVVVTGERSADRRVSVGLLRGCWTTLALSIRLQGDCVARCRGSLTRPSFPRNPYRCARGRFRPT